LAAALDTVAPGGYIVRYGAKHTSPRIEDGVRALSQAGVDHMVGIVLTPHQSSLGSGEYLRRAADAAAATTPPLSFIPIPAWYQAPGFSELLAERTEATLAGLTPEERRRTSVFFTAHSLPERAVTEGDPYPDQVHRSAADIAGRLGLDDIPGLTWGVAWQSAGRTPDPWIGPDLLAEIRRVAAEGATSVVVCPVGFVSDHLEVLFDLDIEAAGIARSSGVAFARTPSFNDDPRFMAVLAEVVRDAAPAGPDAAPAGVPAGAGRSSPSVAHPTPT
jgi:ferrochelatase